jgi:putative peptidoglycan binding protein
VRKKTEREDFMKVRRTIMAAMMFGGSLGMAPALAHSDETLLITREEFVVSSQNIRDNQNNWRDDMKSPHERYPKKIEDDSSLAPGVPGVTEENRVGVSGDGARTVEEALAANGYDPGAVDGFIDLETRAAIREFQRENELVVTGNIDGETARLLGISVAESA